MVMCIILAMLAATRRALAGCTPGAANQRRGLIDGTLNISDALLDLASASAAFWTLDQEIFKNERILAAMQRATASNAGDFAVCSRTGRGFNPNNLVLCGAVRALKLCCPIHSQRMGSGPLKRSGE